LGGCDLDLGHSPDSTTPARPSHDQRIVLAARAELSGLIVHLSATSGAHALVACHRTQLAALVGRPPRARRRARPLSRSQIDARERRAAARFRHWALVCESGELARVLASVAAGISMQPVLGERP
jgi:hypothetical protein